MNYYGNLKDTPDKLESDNRALARRAAAEGFVLLKNEGGALPLKTNKIALYGMGARKTIKGGLGSGSVEERYSVNIEDGLKNAGFSITSLSWLDDYDAEYERDYKEYHDMVEEAVKGLTNPIEIIPLAHSYVFRYPSGRTITQEDVDESATDTAIYVLTRQAGEGADRKLEKGDYYITDIERDNLKILASSYAHTILIINVGGLIDMAFLDEIEGIDAVVLFSQGGEEGGNALADVLSGKVNFSGRLSDTIPMRYEDIPFGDEFGYLDGDLDDDYYKEGIYTGYRYFDSFDKEVRYPFGYGLSYTSFNLAAGSVSLDGTKVNIDVSVTNTGEVSGKEVVEVYVSCPDGAQPKEAKRLVAFTKTGEIKAGSSEGVDLSFDLRDLTSYYEQESQWRLDKGDYVVYVGKDSRDLSSSAILRLDSPVVSMQCHACCVPTDELPDFTPEKDTAGIHERQYDKNVPVINIDPSSIKTIKVDYTEPEITETPEEKAILDGLTTEEEAWFLQGGALQNPPEGALDIAGAAGKTTTALLSKGIKNVVMSDGPAGLNIVPKVKALGDGIFAPAQVPERYNWGLLGKGMTTYIASLNGTDVYRFATAWPVEILLAQTWNTELIEEVGRAVGAEMRAYGISVWLAPGMNIHRNPLGGRTFEYFSEDPVLTGHMAAALTRGVQSHKGRAVCVKHFCCNNREDNRNRMSSDVSERALREIYLKGFEIAVRSAHPGTLMTSYNMLNHVYTCNNHELLTDILRSEWGYEGLIMTDWVATNDKAARPELCAPCGNDLVMPGGDFDRKCILEGIQKGVIPAPVLRKSALRVLRLILN